jgi:hypothetical protein
MTDSLLAAIAKLEAIVKTPLLEARAKSDEKLSELQQLVRCGAIDREMLFKSF